MSNFNIEISNLTEVEVNQETIKEIITQVLKEEKRKKEGLSVAFIGAVRMRKLNKKYRNKNRTTDVLAFPENEVEFGKFQIKGLKRTKTLGEIVVCLRQVKKNSHRLKTPFEEEIARVLIHGTLHLLGYDHEKGSQEAIKMKEKEEKYLNKIKTIIPSSISQTSISQKF